MKPKIVVILLACGFALLVCVCSGSWSAWRFFNAGVNPLREARAAVMGESIEIKEHSRLKSYDQLTVDGIDHGMQFRLGPTAKRGNPQEDLTRLPTTYYHPEGPVGIVLSSADWFPGAVNTYNADARLPAALVADGTLSALGMPLAHLAAAWTEPPIGIIMLNNGALAGYARPYQVVDFYERSPAIVNLSLPKEGAPKFTFLTDAKARGANIRVFEGNERKTFAERAPQSYYRYLFVDTAHGHPGLVSKELITQEAMKAYLASLAENGIIAFHTSSRDFELADVVAATASSLNLATLVAHDQTVGKHDDGHYSCEWVLVARKDAHFDDIRRVCERLPPHAVPGALPFLRAVPVRPDCVWTDAGSNSLVPVRRH
jgi:hypothetical protein